MKRLAKIMVREAVQIVGMVVEEESQDTSWKLYDACCTTPMKKQQ